MIADRFCKKLYSIGLCQIIALITVFTLFFAVGPAMAGYSLELGDKDVEFSGYINQSVAFGIAGDKEDTQEGYQSAVFQAVLEAKTDLSRDLRLFVSGKINTDWAYVTLDDNSEWKGKGFQQSRDDLYFLDDWNDLLYEAHLTWTPGNWNIRLGKQINQWGEMDFSFITNVISPSDFRRGLTDLQVETTLMPVTMAKAEYFVPLESEVLTDLSLEFIFNPNLEFRGNEGWVNGSADTMGIWAPHAYPTAGIPQNVNETFNFDEPDTLSTDGHEFGLRVKAIAWDTLFQLMAWYGRDNVPVTDLGFTSLFFEGSDTAEHRGYYPIQRMVGASVSRELPISVSALGGIRPIVRLEGAFFKDAEEFNFDTWAVEEEDVTKWGVGVEWEVRLNWLNSKYNWAIAPELVEQRRGGDLVGRDFTLYLWSYYLHEKLLPQIVYQRELESEAETILANLVYKPDHHWSYTLQAVFMDGDKSKGSDFYNNKDYVSLTVAYQF